MTRRVRRTLFITFTFIFFFLTITISLYATGYRFNLAWPIKLSQFLVKTGTLILDSEPRQAAITITNKTAWHLAEANRENLTTPTKIKNLLPGEYEVKISLPNYWPFIKDVSIYPGESTYLENIVLFKNDLPIKVFDTKIQPIELTTDKQHLVLKDDKKIIDLKTETETEITLTSDDQPKLPDITFVKPKDVKIITWIDDNQFFYANEFEIYQFNIKDNSKWLVTRISQPLTAILYDPTGYLIYSTDQEINVFNLADWTTTALIKLDKLSPPVLNSQDDTLYFTTKIGTQEGLYKLYIK
jgi:hypothetical protein